jgi:hypothetical protein
MRLLTIQATLRLHDGDISGAWQDITALYRLGRLESQQPSTVNLLVGYTAHGNATDATMILSQYAGLTASQAKEYLSQLQNLPPMQPYWKICDEMERCCSIELLMALVDTRKPDATISSAEYDENGYVFEPNPQTRRIFVALKQLLAKKNTDCTKLLLRFNAWWNRLVDACKCSTAVEASVKLNTLLVEARQEAKRTTDLVLSGKPTPVSDMSPEEKAKHIAALAGLTFWVGMSKNVIYCEKDHQTRENMALITLALAGYRADHQGKYPKTLAELTPTYIDTIPKDMMTGGDFHYKLENGGYRLYSVSRNLKDDGGHNFNDEYDALGGRSASKKVQESDDIVFCVPLKKAEQKPNEAK